MFAAKQRNTQNHIYCEVCHLNQMVYIERRKKRRRMSTFIDEFICFGTFNRRINNEFCYKLALIEIASDTTKQSMTRQIFVFLLVFISANSYVYKSKKHSNFSYLILAECGRSKRMTNNYNKFVSYKFSLVLPRIYYKE